MAEEAERPVIEVVIVDAHDLYRMGLAYYLEGESDLHVVAHAPSGPAGFRLIRQLQPGVVVLDRDLSGIRIGDVAALNARVRRAPGIVVLDASITAAAVTEALAEGANSYLGKNSEVTEIAAAVRTAAAGNSWLSGEVSQIVCERLRDAPPMSVSGEAAERLSAREIEVLKLLARGMDNSEIASALAITASTAKNHVSNILTKLEVPSRILAAIYAIRHGLA
jgi:DNA-binding NarL/FixJ family response regulator